ncbi:MAG: hypothetical protein ABI183_12125 [Polyangiaceae bacterium]
MKDAIGAASESAGVQSIPNDDEGAAALDRFENEGGPCLYVSARFDVPDIDSTSIAQGIRALRTLR